MLTVTAMGYYGYSTCEVFKETIPAQIIQVKKAWTTLLQTQEKWCNKPTNPTAKYNITTLSNNLK